jgi:hypothetical protein
LSSISRARRAFLAFQEEPFSTYAAAKAEQLRAAIEQLPQAVLERAGSDNVVKHLIRAVVVVAPQLDFDRATTTRPDLVAAAGPSASGVLPIPSPGQSVPVMTCRVPVTGDTTLLRYRPASPPPPLPNPLRISLGASSTGEEVCFDIGAGESQTAPLQVEQRIAYLHAASTQLAQDVAEHNAHMRASVTQLLAARRLAADG